MNQKFSALETQVFGSFSNFPAATDTETWEDSKDLGFSSELARRSRRRLLNRDGSFNVRRGGYSLLHSRSLYHFLLNATWPIFLGIVVCTYMAINILFACLYFAGGREALKGANAETWPRFLDCFFFSVQTFATVGYGGLTPGTLAANLLVTVEALLGLLCLALATGLLFARFSRPTAKLLFSKFALVVPHREGTRLEFRVVNERKNQLIYLQARLVMSRLERDGMTIKRRFHDLTLERREIMFFPLHWTIAHRIDEQSPLWNITKQELADSDAEFLVMLSGTDDTFSQTVHSWSSYKHDEIVWGAKFENILEELQDGTIRIDLNRVHDFQRAPLDHARKPQAAEAGSCSANKK